MGTSMGSTTGRTQAAPGAAAAHAKQRMTSALGPRGARQDAGSRWPKRQADDVWEWECLLAEDGEPRAAAWCTMLQQPALMEELPLESAPAVLDVGYLH